MVTQSTGPRPSVPQPSPIRPVVRGKGPVTPPPPRRPLGQDTLVRVQTPQSDMARAVSPFVAAPFRPGNNLELFVDGQEAFPQIHQLIATARTRIDMEFFAFHDDPSGRAIAEHLMQKARQGVQVNVLVDTLSQLGSDMMRDLERAGVRVQRFTNGHKVPLLHANTLTDHRKIVLVDGKVGMTGGMNIGERYEKYWHDFMVKVEGPTLQDIYQKFEGNWKLSGGEKLRSVTLDLAPKGGYSLQVAVTSNTEREIRDSYLAAFRAAKDRIYVQSPYLIDTQMVDALKAAARRGVKVHVIVPSEGDNPAIDVMNRSVINELLAAQVKVYEYDTLNYRVGKHDHETDQFNHGKVATIDGTFTIIGTANMDRRSMALSQEINLHVDSEAFARDVEERIFKRDLMTRARPAHPIAFSTLERAAETILNPLRPLF